MNRFTGALRGGVVAVAVSLATLPALAQPTTTSPSTTSSTDGTTSSTTSVDARRDRGFDWGWLGLLGLAGLLGRKRNDTRSMPMTTGRPTS
jgi:hypothetical protein